MAGSINADGDRDTIDSTSEHGYEHEHQQDAYEDMEVDTDNLPTSSTSPSGPSPFEEELGKKFMRKELPPYDTKVFVNGKTAYLVHKDVLMMASPVFEYLIRRTGIQNDGKYSLKLQIEPSAFKLLNNFLYTNTVPTKLREYNVESALQLLDACFQYNMPHAVSAVAAEIEKIITAECAIKVLTTARRYNLTELEESALKVILENASYILSGDEFVQLGSYDVYRILSHDDLQCTETEVFDAALRWATKISTGTKNFKRTLKYNFSRVFNCIRFPLMTSTELATKTEEAPLDVFHDVDPVDVVNLFYYVSLPQSLKSKRSTSMFSSKPRHFMSPRLQEESTTKTLINRETQTQVSDDPALAGSDVIIQPSTSPMQLSTPKVITSNTRLPQKRPRVGDNEDPNSKIVASTTRPNSKLSVTQKIAENGHSDSDSSDSNFLQIIKVSNRRCEVYEDSTRKYYKKSQVDRDLIGSMLIVDVTLDHNYRPIIVKNCDKIVVDVKCDFIHDGMEYNDDRLYNFLNFIKGFDVMRYLVYDHTGAKKLNIENVWSLDQDVLLKFNGVTFLKLNRSDSELVLNYMSQSLKILSYEKIRPKKLAISNCEFSNKALKDRGKQLESLTLYRVWGEYRLDDLVKDFPNLTELVCWKYVPRKWHPGCLTKEPLYLNFTNVFAARHTLRRLVLYQAELKFPTRCNNIVTRVEELRLDKCRCSNDKRSSHLSDVLHVVFPRLQRFMLLEEDGDPNSGGNLATPDVVNCAKEKISSIQWIRIVGMKWSSTMNKDNTLGEFLKESELPENPTNFLIEKSGTGTWKGTNMDEGEQEPLEIDGGYWTSMDEMEFQWYNLNRFYHTYETFEDYFVQDTSANQGKGTRDIVFPRPILWC